ncbi:hypothetical protein H8959_006501 [Pygathrix nigripes]
MAKAESPKEQDPFTYDYQSLRIGGLIIAGILFILGILIVLSRRCRCKFNQQQRTGEPDEEEGTFRSSIRRLPPAPPHIGPSCFQLLQRAFAAKASSGPLLRPSMATPTQTPTKAPEEPDPFYYDYNTVQTVGMTLATILFLLGILIIITQPANPVSPSFPLQRRPLTLDLPAPSPSPPSPTTVPSPLPPVALSGSPSCSHPGL